MAAATLSRWTPTIPASVMSMLNPFAIDEAAKESPADATKMRGAFLTTIPRQDSATPRLPSPSRSSSSTMFAEPESRQNSDAGSREGSIAGSPSKRSNRPKTRFSVCHPPPTSTTRRRLHRRPRSILQLHALSSTARPRPALDVIHAASCSVHLTRAVARCFTTKHSICPNDLLVMRAEKYSADEEDVDDPEARDIIGLICKGKKEEGGGPKIHLRSGMGWDASQLPNGGYEFSSTDAHGLGLTVRWVQKRQKDGGKPRDKRFNFSTISPNSRRHPVIANLSPTSLEINDSYKMPDPCAITPLSTPKQTSTILTDAMDDDEAGAPEYLGTDDLLREIITMTSIWVTFKEGWSPTVKPDDKDKDLAGVQRSASMMSITPGKSLAAQADTPPGSPGISTLDKRSSIKSVSSSLFRRSSMLSRGHRLSASAITTNEQPDPDLQDSVSRTDSIQKTGRARGDSTSTVLVHRAASNRQKRNQQSSWQIDFLHANETLPEVSREELSSSPAPPTSTRKSLAQPQAESESEGDEEDDDDEQPQASTTTSTSPKVLASRSTLVSPTPPFPTKISTEKRGSGTTTDTTSSGNGPRKSSGNARPRKRSTWRKLLCGPSRSDV